MSINSRCPFPVLLARRAELLARTRTFFDQRGFMEVQTPVMSCESVVDAYLDPIRIPADAVGLDGTPDWYLQTSPELWMKRLLVAGAQSIYQIGPAFRAGELGALHRPEFTMVEWYRVGDSMAQGIELLADLTESLLDRGRPRVVTYRELFLDTCGHDPLSARFASDCDSRLEGADRWDTEPPQGLDRNGTLDWYFSKRIQPHLISPTIVAYYPATQAALAKLSTEFPGTAERFELFVDGVELANGYGELLDVQELNNRIAWQNERRQRRGARQIPVPEKFVAAMQEGLPPCSGCALGFDRLFMVSQGARELADVLIAQEGTR